MSYGTVQAEKMTTESGYSLGAGNASSFKNRLINGGMAIDQRFAGTSTTNSDTYVTDRWYNQNSISGGTVTAQQSTDAPTGFSNSLIKTFTGVSYSGTNGYALVNQAIEKNNIIDLAYGTASAKTVTVSFWVKSSVTGNHSFALQNWASSRRSFLSSYTVNSANTWEFKSITIVGDTSFAPSNALNAVGISVRFCQGAGSQYTGSTADAWVTSDVFFLSGCVTPATTSGATWQITGCQLEVGTVATSFDFRSIGTELGLCQRYYETSYEPGSATGSTNNPSRSIRWFAQSTQSYNNYRVNFSVYKRASPTVSIYNPNTGTINEIRNQDSNINIPASVSGQSVTGFMGLVNNTSVGVSVTLAYHYTADSEL